MNLNSRTKTILAAASRVVVFALALVVFTQVGGTELFGAAKPPLTIDPLNPRIHPAHYEFQYTTKFKAVNASGGCSWSVSDYSLGWAHVSDGFQVYVYYTQIPITFVVTAVCGNETATSTVTYTWMTN